MLKPSQKSLVLFFNQCKHCVSNRLFFASTSLLKEKLPENQSLPIYASTSINCQLIRINDLTIHFLDMNSCINCIEMTIKPQIKCTFLCDGKSFLFNFGLHCRVCFYYFRQGVLQALFKK